MTAAPYESEQAEASPTVIRQSFVFYRPALETRCYDARPNHYCRMRKSWLTCWPSSARTEFYFTSPVWCPLAGWVWQFHSAELCYSIPVFARHSCFHWTHQNLYCLFWSLFVRLTSLFTSFDLLIWSSLLTNLWWTPQIQLFSTSPILWSIFSSQRLFGLW